MPETDERDFEALYRAHAPAVYGYLRSRASHDDACEVLVETFVVAWRRSSRRNLPPDALRPWLIAVARRVLANERRAADRRAALGLRIAALEATEDGGDPASKVVERDATLAAFAQLSGPDREVLGLVAWARLSPNTAARILDCSKATFLMRLHRARTRLAAALSSAEASDLSATGAFDQQAPRLRTFIAKEQST